jgi:bacitracin transport system permease protein
MFNVVYSELLKLKKSYILVITLISGLLMPGVQFIGARRNDFDQVPEEVKEKFLMNHILNIEMMSFHFIYIVIFSLIAAYIFTREFTDKTTNILYSYPIGRVQILIGKYIVVCILVLLVYVIQFIASYLGLYIVWRRLPSADFISNDIKVNIYSALLQFILILIPIFIGNITKNIIFPIVYGVLGAVVGLVLLMFMSKGSIYGQICPLTLPALPVYHYHMRDPIDYVLAIGSATITFVLFTFLCIYNCRNADVS